MPQRRIPVGRVQAKEGKIADILLPVSSAANGRDSHLHSAQQVWFPGSSCVPRCNPRLPNLTDGLDRSSILLGK